MDETTRRAEATTPAKIRLARGLTQQRLAEMAGVSERTVRRLEEGDSGVAIGRIRSIAAVLDVPASMLVQAMEARRAG